MKILILKSILGKDSVAFFWMTNFSLLFADDFQTNPTDISWQKMFFFSFFKIMHYSKASRYTASSCTDLAGARFWIWSKNIWDERIYVMKTLSSTVFWSSCIYPIK